ncbi:MAG: hypothetical protein JXA91_03325 [Candidatus Thermoplasmatota archaeon]|nr:hypothetical protein [Candidatus Thermoplasmatota archaeon]
MHAFLVFLQIMLFCSLSYGVVICGTVTDSISGEPVDSATFIFRIGDCIDSCPVTQSDANGLFRKEVLNPISDPFNVVIAKNDYNSIILRVFVESDSINLGIIKISKYIASAITFSGTVIDSMSQMPISGVRITMKKNSGDINPYKFFTTDSAGSFNQVISVPNNTSLLTSISHSGYYSKSIEITTFTNFVNQIILLQPEGSLQIKVTGQVLDSISGIPVEYAKVILFSTYLSPPDTSYTANDGKFMRFIKAGIVGSPVTPEMYCTIHFDGYDKKIIKKRLSVTSPYSDVDLEEILISKSNSQSLIGQHHSKISSPFEHSKGHSVLTLSGRLVSSDNNIQKPYSVSTQTILRVNKKNNGASKKKLYITGREQ